MNTIRTCADDIFDGPPYDCTTGATVGTTRHTDSRLGLGAYVSDVTHLKSPRDCKRCPRTTEYYSQSFVFPRIIIKILIKQLVTEKFRYPHFFQSYVKMHFLHQGRYLYKIHHLSCASWFGCMVNGPGGSPSLPLPSS